MTDEQSQTLISQNPNNSLNRRPAAKGEGEEESYRSSGNPRKMQRYLVAVEYIGTRFNGAQQQANHRTVVGVLQVLFFDLLLLKF